jgi:hypothetical protein
LLSDAALSIAIGCEIKWLYNSAHRLARAVHRSTVDATWWRLVHHFAVGLGMPLADAARSADALLVPGMAPGRVRLRATQDDSVAVSIDLARFHDGAVLALAAAICLARPKTRGRPRKHPESVSAVGFSQSEMETIVRLRMFSPQERLMQSIASGSGNASLASPGASVLRALFAVGVPLVIVGQTAAMFHCAPWPSDSLDLCIDASSRHAGSVARTLNVLEATPRGIAARDGFRIDPSIIAAVPVLALRAGGASVNLFPSVEGIGEYAQVEQLSAGVPFDESQIRVLGMPGLLRSASPAPVANDASSRARWLRFAASQDSASGTR